MPLPYVHNNLPAYGQPLATSDAETLGLAAADRAVRVLALRANNSATPLYALPALARNLGIGSLYLKDEGFRLGLGSFKALGGAYALIVLVKEEAERQLGRVVKVDELLSSDIRAVSANMIFACATDGNHGRSVAQGAQLMDARAKIFVHSGVSEPRIAAIAQFGADVIRVDGNYDDSVAEASRVAKENGWTVLSDTSWPGYEYIPGLVMQGYLAMMRECLTELPEQPTHLFLQAGVGGFAAAVAGHMSVLFGNEAPHVTIVEPVRAACLYESARVGKSVKVAHAEPTIMAMLECYEPSMVAFRILSRVADGFMTVDEVDAVEAMRRLAAPSAGDPPVVAGESGGAGLAGVMAVIRDTALATKIGLGPNARVLVINTEGATDPSLYERLIGSSPETILKRRRTS